MYGKKWKKMPKKMRKLADLVCTKAAKYKKARQCHHIAATSTVVSVEVILQHTL
jgi:hypothetical protein